MKKPKALKLQGNQLVDIIYATEDRWFIKMAYPDILQEEIPAIIRWLIDVETWRFDNEPIPNASANPKRASRKRSSVPNKAAKSSSKRPKQK